MLHPTRPLVSAKVLVLRCALVSGAVALGMADGEQIDPGSLFKNIPPAGRAVKDTGGRIPGDPERAVRQLKLVWRMMRVYRTKHGGEFPIHMGALLRSAMKDPSAYGFTKPEEPNASLLNPDCRFAVGFPEKCNPYALFTRRRDGSPVGSAKPNSGRDAWAYTDLFVHKNARLFQRGSTLNPVGFYLVLWEDGEVERLPYDQVVRVVRGRGWVVAFPGSVGVPPDCITYDEFWTKIGRMNAPPRGKPVAQGATIALPDNGGPEALVSLSRLLSAPIEREKLWELLDPAEEVFSLGDLREAGKHFGLSLQEERIGLGELARRARPAILRLRNPDRLIALGTIDTSHALIHDKGWLQFVARSLVSERYVGEALMSTPVESVAPLRVEHPLRQVELKTFGDTVSETFSLTNVGTKPLRLQLELPACGCTSIELSPEDLPPTATSTLRATIRPRGAGNPRWATQFTAIAIRTNDPASPRVMLGVGLHVQPPKQ